MFGKKKEHTTRQAKLGAKTRLFCFRDDLKCDPGQFIDQPSFPRDQHRTSMGLTMDLSQGEIYFRVSSGWQPRLVSLNSISYKRYMYIERDSLQIYRLFIRGSILLNPKDAKYNCILDILLKQPKYVSSLILTFNSSMARVTLIKDIE